MNVNSMTGPLPTSWSSLSNLQLLFLRDNQLTGEHYVFSYHAATMWPGQLFNAPHMICSPSLSHAPGTMPTEWSSLASLQSLSLADNALSGSIPASWGPSLSTMRFLDLAGNR